MFSQEIIFFTCFLLFVATILVLDLGVLSRNNHIVAFKEALAWTMVWVISAIGFYFFILNFGGIIHGINDSEILEKIARKYLSETEQKKYSFQAENFTQELSLYNSSTASDFLTGWILEYSLSVDNIFVIILILTSFNVKENLYKKVLVWGILGAIIMRFTFIFLGSFLIQRFHFILYFFSVFLIFSGFKLLKEFFNADPKEELDPANHVVTRTLNKLFPKVLYLTFVKDYFFVVKSGKLMVTPLFVVVLVVEVSDLIFAVDSVPAVFAVTQDPYIVFFSNIFAILGLRSMFFFLSNIMHLFRYLKVGLAIVLIFIGGKMLTEEWWLAIGFEKFHSIYVILAILIGSVLFSILNPEKKGANARV